MCPPQGLAKDATQTVVQELVELLASRPKDVSIDELGHLYCYKHGETILQALKSAGCTLRFLDFLKSQSQFSVDKDCVNLVAPPGLNKVPAAPPGLETALRKAPWRKEKQAAEDAPPPANAEAVAEGSSSEPYLQLHNKVSGRSFNSRVAQILAEVQDVFEHAMFLNVRHVVKGGSAGRGTAIQGSAAAELVFSLDGLPRGASMGRWLPAALRAVAAVVQANLEASPGQYVGADSIRLAADCIVVRAEDVCVDVRLVRAFDSNAEAIACLAKQDFEERRITAAALVQAKTLFLAKQPGQVKVTCRLLKWWREQQEWSTPLARPSDELLDIIGVYSAVMSKPVDQAAAMDNVMAALAHFDELRIVWTNFYSKNDVWAPLLQQRPLVMDPANPFVNLADPQLFDPQELMAKARNTHFFY